MVSVRIVQLFKFTYKIFVIGAIALSDSRFAEPNSLIAISSLECTGNEDRLFSCNVNSGIPATCGRFEDAAIVCQGFLHA